MTDLTPLLYTLAVVIAVKLTPLRPLLGWVETYFHELSHGLACLLTFGSVRRIELNLDGSGVCTTQGGWRFFILLAGYAGAVVWGTLIYVAGWSMDAFGVEYLLHGLAILVAVSVFFWARDFITIFVLLCLAGLFIAPTLLHNVEILPQIVEVLGLATVLNALRAPLDLIDGRHVGDGAMLANMTLIPEFIWVLLWLTFGLFACTIIVELHHPLGLLNLWWEYNV